MTKIIMIIAFQGFRDEEYFVPKELFEGYGVDVVTASSQLGVATGKLGGIANVDILLNSVNVDDYDAMIFVGGPGVANYQDDPLAQGLAKQMNAKEKIIGALSMAPVILGNAGLLKRKQATAYKDYVRDIIEKGAIYIGKTVEADGNVVTGDGPYASEAFAKKILKKLKVPLNT